MQTKERISCDAIDCDELIYSMGEYHCLKKRAVTNGRICIRCRFERLYKLEKELFKDLKHG